MFATGGSGISCLPFRRRILYSFESALQKFGVADRYVKAFHINGAIILMYHSVPHKHDSFWIHPSNRIDPQVFEQQVQWLSANRNVIGMDDVLDALDHGISLPAGTVVITFDDGYRDLLTIAAPILARYNLPAVAYLPTEYITRAENHWSDRLYTAFRTRTRDLLSISGRYFDLFAEGTAEQAYEFLHEQLLKVDYATRDSLLASVERQLRPSGVMSRLTLNWDEVRQLVSSYPQIAVGIHTANHIDLTNGPSEVIRSELQQSVADVMREVGVQPVHFSFPYNRYSREACGILRELNCKSAVCSGVDCLVDSGSDPFMLPRVSVPDSMSLFQFRTSGAYPGLPKAILGRA